MLNAAVRDPDLGGAAPFLPASPGTVRP